MEAQPLSDQPMLLRLLVGIVDTAQADGEVGDIGQGDARLPA